MTTPMNAALEKTCKINSVEQSYRANLLWALDAAGKFHRINTEPKECPNEAAFYLYVLARDEPKDFFTKLNAVESKVDDGQKATRRESQASIKEIRHMLETLKEGEREDE